MAKGKANTVLRVDISDTRALVDGLRAVYTEETIGRIMYRVFRRAATRTKTITQREVPADYYAKKAWIGRAFGPPKISTGARMECLIPLDGARGYIGKGGAFRAAATGPTPGGGTSQVRKAYTERKGKKTRRAYKINAQIVTGNTTTLPTGEGRTHFMVFSGPYKGRVFARMSKKRENIRPATGLGVPQMPMTRTREAVQAGVLETVKARIEHEHAYELRKAAGKWMV